MKAVEFTTELNGNAALIIPQEIATQLPKNGFARVILLTDCEESTEAEWRAGSYEQFLANDAPEDAIYESLR